MNVKRSVLAIIAVLVFLPATAGTGASSQYEIRLKSRAFVPPEGFDPFLASGRRHGTIQFFSLPTEAEHHAIRAAGIMLHDYLPNLAYTATLTAPLEPRGLSALDVRALFSLGPTDKLSPSILRGSIGDWARPERGKVDVNTIVFPGLLMRIAGTDTSGRASHRLLLRTLGIDAELLDASGFFQTLRLRVRERDLSVLASSEWVQWIEPVPPSQAVNNDDARACVNVDPVQGPPLGLTGAGVNVGVWDGGDAVEHDDFGDRVTNVGPFLPDSFSDHPTHVVGTLAGDGSRSAAEGGDPLQWRGMATQSDVFLWGIGLCDLGHCFHEQMLAALDESAQDIDLATNSWSWMVDQTNCEEFGDYDAYARYVDQLVAIKGLSIFFSAGNDRVKCLCGTTEENGYGTMPFGGQTAKNDVVVGALDKAKQMSQYSSWGPTDDGRVAPDVVALGGAALPMTCETLGKGECSDGVISTDEDNGYVGPGSFCGTSMACPAVAGTAALLVESYRKQPFIIDPSATPPPGLLKALLLNNSDDMGNSGPDYQFGYGRVNALASVEALAAAAFRTGVVSQGSGVDPRTHTLRISRVEAQGCTIKVMLVWSDTAAAANAAGSLVNDLDLRLISPSNIAFRPLTLDPVSPGDQAVPGDNHRDNVEQVIVTAAAAGVWTIHVAGDVPDPGAGQPYVVTWRVEGCRAEGGPQT